MTAFVRLTSWHEKEDAQFGADTRVGRYVVRADQIALMIDDCGSSPRATRIHFTYPGLPGYEKPYFDARETVAEILAQFDHQR